MAKLQHDRVPDQTLTAGSAPDPVRPAVLSMRLWTPGENTPSGNSFWKSDAPAVCLTLDLITTSGGIPKPAEGRTLSADFPSVRQAVLAARRLQWALQGIAENEAGKRTAAAVLIGSVDASGNPGGSFTAAFENAAPGQILLSNNICETLLDVPGLSLRNTSDGAFCELLWRSSEATPGYAADEQALLRLIRELGREDPSPPKPEIPIARPEPPVIKPVTASHEPPVVLPLPVAPDADDLIHSRGHREAEPPGNHKKWLIPAGAAAVLLCLVALSWAVFHSSSGASAKTPAATEQPVAAEKQGVPGKQPATLKPSPAGQPALPNRAELQPHGQPPLSLTPVKAGSKKPSSVAGGSCDFTEADIERSLVRAENYMHAGKLSDAQGAFQAVAGCPTAREKAQAGLQRVRERMEAQNLSSTP